MTRASNIEEALLALTKERLSNRTRKHGIAVGGRRNKADHVDALVLGRRLSEVLDLLRGEDLRALCKTLELPSSGNKDTLHKRVEAALAPPRAASKTGARKRTARARKRTGATQSSRAQRRDARRRRGAEGRNREHASSSLGWDDIQADALEAFRTDEFERLCAELVRIERHDRHATSTHVEGPPALSRPGDDLRLIASEAPSRSRETYQQQWTLEALTDDDIGTTVYSCKTGLEWRAEVLSEAKERSVWALDTLREGGRLTIVINEPRDRSKKSEPLETQLARAYRKRMKGRNKPRQASIASRIRVIDANDLATFLRGRRPLRLSRRFRERLGCRQIPGLLEFDQWASGHERDRGRPELGSLDYERDPDRESVRAELLAVMRGTHSEHSPNVAWLIGRPGVGKTRLIIELLREYQDVGQRTLVATSAEEGYRALSEHRIFKRFPTAVLIVDDCPPPELDRLEWWLTDMRGGAVIAITPGAEDYSPRGVSSVFSRRRIRLRPLASSTNERLIRQILDGPDTTRAVQQIAALTEGYPWFAILVARAYRESGQLPQTITDAAELALRSRDEPGERSLMRARVLLLVLMTEDLDWDVLPTQVLNDLCAAVDLRDRREVNDLFDECVNRGLIRTRLGRIYKYVTPAILARAVLLMLLDPPPGRPRLGPRLREHAAEYLPRLYEKLDSLTLPRTVLHRLAAPIVRELESGASPTRVELTFAARHGDQPARLAAVLERLVARIPLTELQPDAERRARYYDAVVCLAHRRGSFEAAESALFRLAATDGDTVFYKSSQRWEERFIIAHNQTYRRFPERLRRLRQRCTEVLDDLGQPGRVLALDGVQAALDGDSDWHAPIDGPYLEPTGQEVVQARGQAWHLLMDCMLDPESDVSERASKISVACLSRPRSAALPVEVIERLVQIVPGLPEPVQRGLRRSVEDVCELYAVDAAAAGHGPFAALRDALLPRAYSERLRHHVGSYSAFADGGESALDVALAREGLQPPGRSVVAEAGWLVSGEAERGVAFTIALGTEDRDGVMREPFMNCLGARDAANVVSAYFLGWQRAGRERDVSALLRAQLADDRVTGLVTHLLYRLGANDERIAILATLLERPGLADESLRVFSMGWNVQDASVEAVLGLARLLRQRDARYARVFELALLLTLGRERPDSAAQFTDMLAGALCTMALAQERGERLEGGLAVRWRRGIALLAKADADVDLSQFFLDALSHGSSSLGKTPIWKAFEEYAARHPQQVFDALTRLYRERDPAVTRRLTRRLAEHHIVEKLDRAHILEWIGLDHDQASFIARSVDINHHTPLPELARELIVRFGTNAQCAAIFVQAMTHPGAMAGSLAEWLANQLARTQAWLEDTDTSVQEWTRDVRDTLQSLHERQRAHEEHEALRWRTSQLAQTG